MKNIVHKINHLLSGFAGWLMLAMMLLLVVDIVFRTIDYPLHGMAELSVFVMMIVIYLGFARCEQFLEHVGLEVVTSRLPAKEQRHLFFLRQSLAVCSIGLLFFAVSKDSWSAFQTGSSIEGTVELPIWPTKFIMVIGLFFFLLQALINLSGHTGSEKQGTAPQDIEE